MKRGVSTSTVGDRDEAHNLLLEAYMFQRRVLLGCSLLMLVSLVIWIIAISRDHWIIISGSAGIFIPETRRFFLSSHSGLWRHCRYTVIPNPLPNANVVRNFTSIAFQNATLLNEAKYSVAQSDFIVMFLNRTVEVPIVQFSDEAKELMFASWILDDKNSFETLKAAFAKLVLPTVKSLPANVRIRTVNPLDVSGILARNEFGSALQTLSVNSSDHYIVVPEAAQAAMFKGWEGKIHLAKMVWPYVRDLDVAPYVVSNEGEILQLVPPLPPKRGRQSNGYDYLPNQRCKYIDMFPNAHTLRNEPGFDSNLMDYIRTQASFACITVFVMSLGAVFTFYTFLNPRYMFKRLAGGIQLVSAATALVVIQVLLASVDYTKEHLFYAYPTGAELYYGYGVYLAWFTFGANVVCGCLFIWYSGKKKGSKAPTDELAMADEPTIMGR